MIESMIVPLIFPVFIMFIALWVLDNFMSMFAMIVDLVWSIFTDG